VGAEFIAMLLVIVYVGAVAVLFLFVVMMLNVDFAELRAGFVRYAAIGLAFAVALVSEAVMALWGYSAGAIELARRTAPTPEKVPNIQAIGDLLYTRYLFVFEAAGLVLLVAMIGAIVLTHRERGGTRPQNIARQIARRPQDATRNTQPVVGGGIEL
jgi:NADH-quinone oxidoreductase subunit J